MEFIQAKPRQKANEFLRDDDSKTASPKGGRPRGSSKPDNERAIAERIGIPQKTINRADQHVAPWRSTPNWRTFPKSRPSRKRNAWRA